MMTQTGGCRQRFITPAAPENDTFRFQTELPQALRAEQLHIVNAYERAPFHLAALPPRDQRVLAPRLQEVSSVGSGRHVSVRAVTATSPSVGKSPHVRHAGRRREQPQLCRVWEPGQRTRHCAAVCGASRRRGPLPGTLVSTVLTSSRHRVLLGSSVSAPRPGSAAPTNHTGAEQE